MTRGLTHGVPGDESATSQIVAPQPITTSCRFVTLQTVGTQRAL